MRIITSEDLRRRSDSLQCFLLGCLDWDSGQILQESLIRELLSRDDRGGYLILSEHPPLVTVGREGSVVELAKMTEFESPNWCDGLKWGRVDTRVIHQNRGGGLWLHGPGVLHAMIVIPWSRMNLPLAAVQLALQEAVVGLTQTLRIPVEICEKTATICGRSGVFGFVGLASHSGIAYHGLCLRVCPPPLRFDGDIGERRWTSLASLGHRPVTMSYVRSQLLEQISKKLGYESWSVHTSHPKLVKTRRIVNVDSEYSAHNLRRIPR